MECDRVFVVLTSGPFPAGRQSDAAVNRHLMACAECRRFAEALRPHDKETHEALPGSERESLPSYRGVEQPVTAMAAVMQGGPKAPAIHSRPSAGDWRQDVPMWGPEAQVASFSLAPRRRTATAVEALSMLATLAVAAIAFWCLGVLAL
jgi:hypothetical protein